MLASEDFGLGLAHSRRSLTYGEWLRQGGDQTLSRREKARLVEERVWEQAHPVEVEKLEAMVGWDYQLVRRRETVAAAVEPGASLPVRAQEEPRSWPCGTCVHIFARVGSRLLGETALGTVLLLQADWLEVPR